MHFHALDFQNIKILDLPIQKLMQWAVAVFTRSSNFMIIALLPHSYPIKNIIKSP